MFVTSLTCKKLEKGQFTFTTHTPGNHKMCISSNETTWTMPGSGMGPQKLRIDLSLSIGENKDYYKVSNSDCYEKDNCDKVLTAFLAYGERRQTFWAPTPSCPIVRSDLADSKGARLSTISRRGLPQNFRNFELSSPLVGRRPSNTVYCSWTVANDSYEIILFEEENRLKDTR